MFLRGQNKRGNPHRTLYDSPVLSLLLTAVVASAAPQGDTVLVLDLKAAGIEEDQAEVLNDLVGQSVTRLGAVKVVTSRDVQRIADLQADKDILGCDDESCLSELAGDFGARYVLFGSVGRFAELYVIQLTLFDADAAEAVKRGRVETRDLSNVTRLIDQVVDDTLSSFVVKDEEPAAAPFEVPVAGTLSIGGGALAAAGIVMVIIGVQPALAYGAAQDGLALEQSRFASGDADLAEAARLQQAAQDASDQWDSFGALVTTSGVVVAVVGLAASTVGILMLTDVIGGDE